MTQGELIFRAGAASLNVDPPFDLPMVGVVRRYQLADKRIAPLEVAATAFGNKSYDLPVQVSSDCERLLIETGVRLVRSLFPERVAPKVEGWLASGSLPVPQQPRRMERP